MFRKNVEIILSMLKDSDKVLDIGGWAKPFNRADYVIDLLPYDTRGVLGHQGPDEERFTKENWAVFDLCGRDPLPYPDKFFDFVICSHTLEDIRDPIHVCSEINRVGKAGYIEVPSRLLESIIGLESPKFTGYYHHRWLVTVENGVFTFKFKPPLLNSSWRYHFPSKRLKQLKPEEWNSWMFWQDSFRYREVITTSLSKIRRELESFVIENNGYPSWKYLIAPLSSPKTAIEKKVMSSTVLAPIAIKLLGKAFAESISKRKESDAFWESIPEITST